MELSSERLKELLKEIEEVKIGIYGDFCLDSYWILDPRGSEISLETGLQAQAVKKQKYSLGGASNVAANLATLNPKEIKVFGIAGNDIFGKEMSRQLQEIGCNVSNLLTQFDDFDTYTFCKLILDGREQPRLDFGTYNKRLPETDRQLINTLAKEVDDLDIIILNQQVPFSITNTSFIDDLNELIANHNDKLFIVDSRHYTDKFKGVSLKANDIEASQLAGKKVEEVKVSEDQLENIAKELSKKYKRPMFITLGAEGILAADQDMTFRVKGLKIDRELDIVGAGDTVISAIACSYAAGASISEAIEFANFAAGVTVQKLYTTGTASGKEIIELYSEYSG